MKESRPLKYDSNEPHHHQILIIIKYIIFCLYKYTKLVKVHLTGIHGFISSLHNAPVYAGHQPRSHHNAAQQPQYAVADPHHHVVEKEEVVEAVERLPEVEEEKLCFHITLN